MPSKDIRRNLATEEYLMNNVDISEPCLLLYIQKPCVIIGRNQNAYQEINFSFMREQGIVLTRRTSGGGAVYDDLGNLSFSFVAKTSEQTFGDYQSATLPIQTALQKMGATGVKVKSRNDLYIDEKKFSGNAMYTKKGRTYSHGTLMYDVDLSILEKVLHVPQEKINSKATKSVRKSVTNIKPYLTPRFQKATTEEFRDVLLCQIFQVEELAEIADKKIQLTAADQAAIDHLVETKYANDAWIFDEAPHYELHRKKRIPEVGIVAIDFAVAKGVIQGMHISGDFFGQKDIHQLVEGLCGETYEWRHLKNYLATIDVSEYIHHLTTEAFLELLIG